MLMLLSSGRSREAMATWVTGRVLSEAARPA